MTAAYVYVPAKLKTAGGTAVIALMGHAYARELESVRLVSIDVSGQPYVLFSSPTFEIRDVADVDGDGVAEFIGKPSLAEQSGSCFESYDPFSVYQLPKDPGPIAAVLSIPLSERYNVDHYYGWAGPKAREDFVVVRCAPGKPLVMTRADAEREFGNADDSPDGAVKSP